MVGAVGSGRGPPPTGLLVPIRTSLASLKAFLYADLQGNWGSDQDAICPMKSMIEHAMASPSGEPSRGSGTVELFMAGRGTRALVLTLLLGASLQAAEGDGGAAAYRQLGVGARAIGGGGAVTASVSDATASYWNPAALTRLEEPEVAAMHANLNLDRSFNYVSYAVPINARSAWAVSYTRFSVSAIPETRVDAAGNPIEIDGNATVGDSAVKVFSLFDDVEENVTVGYSREISDSLRLGANMRYLRQSLFDATANGFGFDLGMIYEYSNRLAFGLSLRDVAESLRWNGSSSASDNVSMTSSVGVAFRPSQGLKLDLDVAKTGEAQGVVRVGAEKWFAEKYGVRLGSNDGEMTAGASLKMKEWEFDYAFAAGDLGDIQRVSLLKRF